MTGSLLPPNATAFEHAIEAATAYDTRIAGIAAIAGAKLRVPDTLIPYLLWEYGLTELEPYLTDPRRAIAEGIRWQRIRGTPRSLAMAMTWVGFEGARREEGGIGVRWTSVQLDPGRVPSREEAIRIIGVGRLSLPARSRLARLHHDYDLRMLVGDYGVAENTMWDDWSGTELDGVVQSYGWRLAGRIVRVPTSARAAELDVIAGRAYHDRLPRADHLRWESPLRRTAPAPAAVEAVVVHGDGRPTRIVAADLWDVPVSALADGVVTETVDAIYDGLYARERVAGSPAVGDEAAYENLERWVLRPVDRVVLAPIGAVTVAGAVPTPVLVTVETIAVAGGRRPDARWEQPLDDRGSRAAATDTTAVRDRADTGWGDGPWLDQLWGVVSPAAAATADMVLLRAVAEDTVTLNAGVETLAAAITRPPAGAAIAVTELSGAAAPSPDAPWGLGLWPDQPWGAATAGYIYEELTV